MSRCCPHLQALFIYGKLFYSPQECSSFILAGVYTPPQACVSGALQRLANQITSMEQERPDSLLIILGGILKEQTSAMNRTNTDSILSISPGTETHHHTVLKDDTALLHAGFGPFGHSFPRSSHMKTKI